jgi:hypothetical protein
MGRGGGEGRVPSLRFLFIYFIFGCLVHGAFGINGNVMRVSLTVFLLGGKVGIWKQARELVSDHE